MPYRRYTSRKDLAELFLRQDGKCSCGTKLIKGNYIIEHSTALALGGTDTLTNKYLNCKPCAAIKTYGKSKATTYGSDIHAISKLKRLTTCKPKRKQLLQSRGFDQRFSKRMDGSVVRRK